MTTAQCIKCKSSNTCFFKTIFQYMRYLEDHDVRSLFLTWPNPSEETLVWETWGFGVYGLWWIPLAAHGHAPFQNPFSKLQAAEHASLELFAWPNVW